MGCLRATSALIDAVYNYLVNITERLRQRNCDGMCSPLFLNSPKEPKSRVLICVLSSH